MSAILFGLATALAWGTADFIARFTARGFGTRAALAGMFVISATLLITLVWLLGIEVNRSTQALHWLLLGGIGVYAGTGLLYWGLARGPISVAAPIAASYPALNLILAALQGVPLSSMQWLLLVAMLAGVVVISAFSDQSGELRELPARHIRRTAIIGMGAAVGLAGGVIGLQNASPVYGEWATLAGARSVSAIAAIGVLAMSGRPDVQARRPGALAGLLALQALIDALAYLTLIMGSQGTGAPVVVVIGSGFTIVTLVLARVFLKERVGLLQTVGIAAVIVSVAALSYLEA